MGQQFHQYQQNEESTLSSIKNTVWIENCRYLIMVHGCLWFMMFYATFNNITVISWQSVLLGENHQSVASHWQTLSHNIVSSTPPHEHGSNPQL